MPANADFHMFKVGIEPKWEDPECANGGKWTVAVNRKSNLDTMWLETVSNGKVSYIVHVYAIVLFCQEAPGGNKLTS